MSITPAEARNSVPDSRAAGSGGASGDADLGALVASITADAAPNWSADDTIALFRYFARSLTAGRDNDDDGALDQGAQAALAALQGLIAAHGGHIPDAVFLEYLPVPRTSYFRHQTGRFRREALLLLAAIPALADRTALRATLREIRDIDLRWALVRSAVQTDDRSEAFRACLRMDPLFCVQQLKAYPRVVAALAPADLAPLFLSRRADIREQALTFLGMAQGAPEPEFTVSERASNDDRPRTVRRG